MRRNHAGAARTSPTPHPTQRRTSPPPNKAYIRHPAAAARLPLPPLRRPRPRRALLRRRHHARAAGAAARDHQRLPRRQQLAQQRAAAPALDDRAERHWHAQRRRRRAPPQRAPAARAPRLPPRCGRADHWAGAGHRYGRLIGPNGSGHSVMPPSAPCCKNRQPWLITCRRELHACCCAMDLWHATQAATARPRTAPRGGSRARTGAPRCRSPGCPPRRPCRTAAGARAGAAGCRARGPPPACRSTGPPLSAPPDSASALGEASTTRPSPARHAALGCGLPHSSRHHTEAAGPREVQGVCRRRAGGARTRRTRPRRRRPARPPAGRSAWACCCARGT